MLLQDLSDEKLIHPPEWLIENLHYMCAMGSRAYGVATPDSDFDVYGFAIPPKHIIFPHLIGHIPGFGTKPQSFDQWTEQHIMRREREYDFAIYNIVKFFHLCMGANPNMVDTLFVPANCVMHCTSIGTHVRDHRHLFLSKKCWHTFRGYAYAQMTSIEKRGNTKGKRLELIERYGYDVKFAYHVVRLMREVHQILTEHTLVLDANSEELRAIRAGAWTLERLKSWFDEQMAATEGLYESSTLPHSPDEAAIRNLLHECLEMHYGNLDDAVVNVGKAEQVLRQIKQLASTVV